MRGDVGGATREDVVIRSPWRYQQIALRGGCCPGVCPAGLSVHPKTNEDDFKGQSGQSWLKPRCNVGWDAVVSGSWCHVQLKYRLINPGTQPSLFVSLCQFRRSRVCSMAAMATAGSYAPSIPVPVKSGYLTSLLLPPEVTMMAMRDRQQLN